MPSALRLFQIFGAGVASMLAYVVLFVWLRVRCRRTFGPLAMASFSVIAAIAGPSQLAFHQTMWRLSGWWLFLEEACTLLDIVVVFAAAAIVLLELALFSWSKLRRPRPLPEVTDAAPTRREAIARIGGAIAMTSATTTVLWGALRTRVDFEIVELPIRIARLPRVLDGFTIVQVSDVHVGPFIGDRELSLAEDVVRRIRPDLVVMTGDLIDVQRCWVAAGVSWLARLSSLARHGVAAIPGNHEYYAGAPFVMNAMRSAGIEVLLNDSRIVAAKDGGGFGLIGVDDMHGRDRGGPGPRLGGALAKLADDRARILLSHQPSFFPRAAACGVDLTLSGHTHGGQLAPFGPMLVERVYGYSSGLVAENGSRLYVNRGFGTSGPPLRLGIRPEITKIVLVAG